MKRSFADFEDKAKLACFSDKNEKSPYDIGYTSLKKYFFECDVCHHEIHQQIVGVTSGRAWCGYCRNRKICSKDLECGICYLKTFEYLSPEKALCWNYEKNSVGPGDVVNGSGSKFWFTCNICNHDFQQTLDAVTGKVRWCAFCTNRRLCPDTTNCSTCFDKTFAGKYPEKALCWSGTKNTLRANQVVFGSASKFWFKCKECKHDFQMSPDSIRTKSTWCPHCSRRNKNIEELGKNFSMTNCTYERETLIRLNNRNLYWDMVVYNGTNVFYVESDGPQHFSVEGMIRISRGKVKNAKHRFKDQRHRDLLKEEHIKTTSRLLFRISFRQLSSIEHLVDEMIENSNAGVEGVVYMDEELYKDWGPIVYTDE